MTRINIFGYSARIIRTYGRQYRYITNYERSGPYALAKKWQTAIAAVPLDATAYVMSGGAITRNGKAITVTGDGLFSFPFMDTTRAFSIETTSDTGFALNLGQAAAMRAAINFEDIRGIIRVQRFASPIWCRFAAARPNFDDVSYPGGGVMGLVDNAALAAGVVQLRRTVNNVPVDTPVPLGEWCPFDSQTLIVDNWAGLLKVDYKIYSFENGAAAVVGVAAQGIPEAASIDLPDAPPQSITDVLTPFFARLDPAVPNAAAMLTTHSPDVVYYLYSTYRLVNDMILRIV